jgi:mRNA-degrading endonuclease RelE of RelBE toxin-antitoxin system
VRIEWEDGAKASFRRYLRDQQGMRAVLAAVDALVEKPLPEPPLGFHRGIYHRLHIGPYRVIYYVDGDVVTIRRVDRVAEP